MLQILKRYALAFTFLFLVVFLMLLGTLGVKMFGDKMIEDTNMIMKPRGEEVKI